MKVAVMYSGGKDSTFALDYCLQKGHKVEYLLSVKPNRTDCYLFHFATVEMTKHIAGLLNLRHIYKTFDKADPKQEAWMIADVVKKNPVDAIVLGGVGLQETQIKVLREALRPLNTKVLVPHKGLSHEMLIQKMIDKGYDIRLTQYAADGFTPEWLGRRIDIGSFQELKTRAEKYGFHIGFEGGHADTLVLDAPFFPKRLEILESEKKIEGPYNGHLIVKKFNVVDK